MGGYLSGGGAFMDSEVSAGAAQGILALFKRAFTASSAPDPSRSLAVEPAEEPVKREEQHHEPRMQLPPQWFIPQHALPSSDDELEDDSASTTEGPQPRNIALCTAVVMEVPLAVDVTGWAASEAADERRQRDTALEVAVPAAVLETLGVSAGNLIKVWVPGSTETAHLARVALASSGGRSAGATAGVSSTRETSVSKSDQTSAVTANGLAGADEDSHSHNASPATISTGAAALLSPQLASNLRLGCHMQPLLRDGELTAQHGGAEVLALQAFVTPPRHPRAIPIIVPGKAPVRVPAAIAVTITTVAVPEATLLPSEENPMQPPEPAMPGMPPGEPQPHGVPPAAPAAPGDGAPGAEGDATAAHDEALLDAYQAAVEHFFEAKTRLLCCGDVFCLPVQVTHSLEGALSSMHGGGAGNTKPVYFQVIKLIPEGTETALAVDVQQAYTSINLEGGPGSAPLPVGLPAYQAAESAAESAVEKSGAKAGSEAAGAVKLPLLPPPGAAAAGSPAFLGWQAGAAAAAECWLPGVGPLLPTWREVAAILAPAFHPRAAELGVQASVLVVGPEGVGKTTAIHAAAAALGVHVVPYTCHELRGETDVKTAGALTAAIEAASTYRPAVMLLSDVEVLGEAAAGPAGGPAAAAAAALRLSGTLARGIAAGAPSRHQHPLLVVATTSTAGELTSQLRRCFSHEVTVAAPDRMQRRSLLAALLGGAARSLSAAALDDAAAQSAGMLPREVRAMASAAVCSAAADEEDLDALLDGAPGGSRRLPPRRRPSRLGSGLLAGPAALQVSPQHLQSALEAARKRAATAIGAPTVPDVRWEDVGGLEDVKKAILDTVEMPLRHPGLFAAGLRQRSGVLLYGPPGTGKTLLAKAVATECALNFLAVKGPELINMYIGESERQIREIFARARAARPAVLFFDELDSLAPARGAGADSGGVMDRVVAQLLAEIDGAQSGDGAGGVGTPGVFVIGATNRPDLLDSALLRPGRLDTLLYVGIAEDAASKLPVLKALTRKFRTAPGVDLMPVATACPPTASGADMYGLAADAWTIALRRTLTKSGDDPIPDDAFVEVRQEDFLTAASTLQPSLSQHEIARYTALRDTYRKK